MKKRLYNLLSIFVSLTLLANSFSGVFLFPQEIFAQEASSTDNTQVIKETTDESANAANLGSEAPSEEAASQAEDDKTKEESQPEVLEALEEDLNQAEESAESASLASSLWLENEDGSITTREPVGEGIEYRYKNTQVKIIFTKLTTPGYLTIREFEPENAKDLGILGKAYEITSDMQNGTFEYDLTLPIPSEAKDNLSVKYAENPEELSNAQSVDEPTELTENTITIKGLTHFTVFVVVPNPSPPPESFLEIVIDNTDPEFSVLSGNWRDSTAISGWWGSNYKTTDDRPGGAQVQWEFQVKESGPHEVYAWWTAWPNRGTNVPYTVNYKGGSTTVEVNQRESGGQWNLLGTFDFEAGETYSVVLTNNATSSSDYVIGDAIKVKSIEAPSEVWVDDDWAANTEGDIVGGGKIFGYNAFATIQEGIDAVQGSTVYVAPGTYYENLAINKSVELQGESGAIIDGGASGNVISVSADSVIIDGFELRNGYNGITGETSDSVFSNNIIHDNLNIPGSAGVGILLWGDNDDNQILNNVIYNNDRQGIFIGHCDFAGPNWGCTEEGTSISTGNTISGNTIYNNGLYLNANGPDESEYGIQLWNADYNNISENEVYGHNDWDWNFAQGIYLIASSFNTVTGNYLHDNTYGTVAWQGSENVYYDNIFSDNAISNAWEVDPSANSWDDGSKGNWWSDYGGVDLDGDGVGDTQIPYSNGGVNDRYPQTKNYLSAQVTSVTTNKDYYKEGDVFEIEVQVTNDGKLTLDPTKEKLTVNVKGPNGWISGSFREQQGLDLVPGESRTFTFYTSPQTIPGSWSEGEYTVYTSIYTPRANPPGWLSGGQSSNTKFIVDKTAPQTEEPLDSPEDGSFWNEPIEILGTSTDNFWTGLLNLFYRPAGSSDPWTSITSLSNDENDAVFDWSYLWTPAEEGSYDIKASAVDAAGNEEASAIAEDITYDVTAPDVEITSPTSTLLRGTVPVRGSVTDDNPHHYWLVIQDSNGVTVAGPGVVYDTNSFTDKHFFDWDTTLVPDGTYTIKLEARDAADNKDGGSVQWMEVTVDNTAPEIIFEEPANGSSHAGTIHLKATCNEECDYINFWWRAEGESYSSSSKRYHYIFDNGTVFEWDLDSLNAQKWDGTVYTLNDGIYYLYAAGKDLAGNWARTPDIQITVDNTAPFEGSLIINGDDPYTNSRDVVLSISASDETSTVAEMNIANWTSYAGWEPYATTRAWQLPDTDGEKTVRVKFRDSLGNENSSYLASDTIILDRVDPTSEPTSPGPGFYNADTWDGTIEGTVSDDRSGVNKVEVSIKVVTPDNETKYWDGDSWETGETWIEANGTTSWSYTIAAPIEGTYTFYSRATDNAGNTEETGVLEGVVYDITPPTVSWNDPSDGDTLIGVVPLDVASDDNLSGVDTTRIYFAPAGSGIEAEIIGSSWDTSAPLALGEYDLIARVRDQAGNETEETIQVGVAAIISNENSTTPTQTTAIITWTTDRPTSSRVIYDTVPHYDLGDPPNYGYAYSTGTFNTDPKVTNHTVIITGLTDGTVYYYRVVSAGSPTAVGNQYLFKTLTYAGPPPGGGGGGAVAGITAPPAPPAPPAPGLVAGATTEVEEGVESVEQEVLGEETEATPIPETEETKEMQGGWLANKLIKTALWIILGSFALLILYLLFFKKKREKS